MAFEPREDMKTRLISSEELAALEACKQFQTLNGSPEKATCSCEYSQGNFNCKRNPF